MKQLKEQIQSVIDIFQSGNLLKAEELSKSLIKTNPEVPFLYNLLGLVLAEQNKIDQAIESYEKGLKIDPNFAMIYNNLGLLYYNKKNDSSIKKAENFYKKSISLNEKIAEPHNNLGNVYKGRSEYKEAEDCYKRAIFINSKFAYSHYNLGSLFIAMGKFNEAKKSLREAIKLNPNLTYAHKELSRITKYTNKEEHFNELLNLYKHTNINNTKNRINLGFALGKAYEDIKKYDESFKYYKEANLLCKKKSNFSLKSKEKKFSEIKDIFDRHLFDKFHESGSIKGSPIFIVGMPRSGTTLVEQILSNHPKVFGGDEVEILPDLIKKNFKDNNLSLFLKGVVDFDKENLKIIGNEYLSKMNDLSNNSARFTDKLTVNFLSIGIIKLILPKSRIVHCYRNPEDNIFSIFKNYFTDDRVDFSYDLNDMVEYYNLYQELMKYWNSILKDFIFNIKYENLILNTENEIKNLLKFCDLNWSNDCLNFYNNKRPIKTASDIQVRNKIYNTSINSWKNYENHLNEYFLKLKN